MRIFLVCLGIVFLHGCDDPSAPSPVAFPDTLFGQDVNSSDIFEKEDTSFPLEDGVGSDSVEFEPDVLEEDPLCPEGMVFIPEGSFEMGDENGNPDAQPPHSVSLSAYCIDATEVSVAAYEACVDEEVCDDLKTFEICLTNDPIRPNSCRTGREDHPANYISWTRADIFCQWAGKALPTEAQWERAARGLDGSSYPWGENIGCKFANYEKGPIFDECATEGVGGDTQPVDSHLLGTTEEGLFNMAGNVDEWVADWYSSFAYQDEVTTDPVGPETGAFKVFRGGGFLSPAFTLLTYWRQSGLGADIASQTSGFRCASIPLP